MRERPIVTIDGPSAAGKTTASRLLAERAGLLRLDTGAMYRACALAAARAGVPWSDATMLGSLCASLSISFRDEGGRLRTFLDGEDVSHAIRTPEMSAGASEVSAHGPVREAMVALQRRLGREGGVVLEGRDTGTVVFPDADLKFFLDAAAAVRARRRWLEWGAGAGMGFEEIFRDVLRRDARDSTRDHSPLTVAEGAVFIDSTLLSPEEVVEAMMERLTALSRSAGRPAEKAAREGAGGCGG